jgi:hypothetical protein
MAYVSAILVAVEQGFRAWRRRRERIRTRRIIEGLPTSIRKDIGWAAPAVGQRFETLPDR